MTTFSQEQIGQFCPHPYPREYSSEAVGLIAHDTSSKTQFRHHCLHHPLQSLQSGYLPSRGLHRHCFHANSLLEDKYPKERNHTSLTCISQKLCNCWTPTRTTINIYQNGGMNLSCLHITTLDLQFMCQLLPHYPSF